MGSFTPGEIQPRRETTSEAASESRPNSKSGVSIRISFSSLTAPSSASAGAENNASTTLRRRISKSLPKQMGSTYASLGTWSMTPARRGRGTPHDQLSLWHPLITISGIIYHGNESGSFRVTRSTGTSSSKKEEVDVAAFQTNGDGDEEQTLVFRAIRFLRRNKSLSTPRTSSGSSAPIYARTDGPRTRAAKPRTPTAPHCMLIARSPCTLRQEASPSKKAFAAQ